jgi:catechol 2,3-dioxygenase
MTETATSAPLFAATVTLAVHDLDGISRYYQDLLGLRPLPDAPGGRVTLSAGATPLMHLVHAPQARPETGREPGLFHTAFLLPDRAALAAWLHHATKLGIELQGASDHGVSEAIYLSDPEGNGIEVYADRPRHAWPQNPGSGAGMFNRRLDLRALLDTVAGPALSPAGTVIGHVHLRTNDVPASEAFYTGLGMAVMQHMRQASFMSTGSYHHHVAVNTWATGGSPRRTAGLTGLMELELRARDASIFGRVAEALRCTGAVLEETTDAVLAEDPAGNTIRFSLAR